jgi:hypothetical protein
MLDVAFNPISYYLSNILSTTEGDSFVSLYLSDTYCHMHGIPDSTSPESALTFMALVLRGVTLFKAALKAWMNKNLHNDISIGVAAVPSRRWSVILRSSSGSSFQLH